MTGARIDLDVGGERFAALRFGEPSSPPLLCLHGFPDHPPSFAPFAVALAARGFRVVVPWLRGYWPSPLDGDVDIEALAADAIGMLEAISAAGEPRYLVGHDWGAAITYAALARREVDVVAACAISVPHPWAFLKNALRSPAQLARSRYMARFQPTSADARVRRDDFAEIRQLWKTWSPSLDLDAKTWSSLRATLESSGGRPLDYYRAMARTSALRAIARLGRARIETPTTTLFGSDDGCISAEMARGSEGLFAGEYSLEVIEGAGHFIHVEAPALLAERVARRLGVDRRPARDR